MAEIIENADSIINQITTDSDEESSRILKKAKEIEVSRRKEIQNRIERIKNDIIESAKTEAELEYKRIISGINLEISRLIIKEEDKLIKYVLDKAVEKLNEYITHDKIDIWKSMIIDNAVLINDDKIIIKLDKNLYNLFNNTETINALKNETKKDISLVEEPKIKGLIILNKAENLICDNTIKVLVRRKEMELRGYIHKEVFS